MPEGPSPHLIVYTNTKHIVTGNIQRRGKEMNQFYITKQMSSALRGRACTHGRGMTNANFIDKRLREDEEETGMKRRVGKVFNHHLRMTCPKM
jgi:hypothetical protein